MNPDNIIRSCAKFLDTCKNIPETIKYRVSILIVDASGSMYATDWEPSRLEAAKQAAKAFVKRLLAEEPDARVAVIAYGDNAVVLCSLTPVTMYSKLEQGIDSICDMGTTNITTGLETACDMLKDSASPGQIVLLTDGHHNASSDPKSISDKLRKHAVIECVGIGGSPADVDEELLKYIASSHPDGSKRYGWIGDKERLIQHFHNLAGRIVRA